MRSASPGQGRGINSPFPENLATRFLNFSSFKVSGVAITRTRGDRQTQCLTYQIPGGMLSNLLSQLKQMNALDRLDEALLETPRVREDMGYPPLVTPTSQMVGVQAVTNVLQGERYKKVSKEIKAYCRGEYGTTPAPINPEIQKMILGDEKPLEGRYADTLAPIVEPTRKKLEGIAKSDEDVLSYIAFPNLAEKFFEERKAKEENEVTYTITEC